MIPSDTLSVKTILLATDGSEDAVLAARAAAKAFRKAITYLTHQNTHQESWPLSNYANCAVSSRCPLGGTDSVVLFAALFGESSCSTVTVS